MAAQVFGRYVVVRPLTGHGLVEVFEARDPQLERRVAVKVIHRPADPDTEFDERFRHEARLIAALRHPHIVQVYDFDVVDGQPYMVMEYLEGGTLAERLTEQAARGEQIALPEVVRIFEPLADALDAAHGQGIVHGALSPANILFTARGQPVLTDFGIAQILGQLSLTNLAGIGGAPAYVSPEQARGKPLDARSDVYSLGAILFEVVTGSPPFAGDTPAGVMLQHVAEPVPSPDRIASGLPPGIAGVLGRALAKDPAARYGSARELVRAFAAAVQGEPVSVQGEKPPAGKMPGWIKPLAGASELLAPLIGRSVPAIHEAPRDRRGLVATILGMLGILLAALQFAVAALDLVTRGLAQMARVLPYFIGVLLGTAAVLSVYWGLRAPTRTARRRAVILLTAVLLIGGAWGGWTLYNRARPPSGIIIAVGDFEGKASRQVDFARRIYEGLKGAVADSGGKVILQRTFQAYPDDAQARARGAALKATLVIWGWYDDAGVSPRVELLRIPSLATQPLDLPFVVTSAFASEPAAASPGLKLGDVAHYIRTPLTMPAVDVFVKDGPQQMTYVSTLLLGLIYYANGDTQHALAYLDKALANAPAGGGEIVGQEVALFQRSVLYYQQNRLVEAQADLERALSIKPDFYEAHHNLAILYAATCSPARRLDDALFQAQTAARLKPDSAEAHRLLGDLYRQAGRRAEAVVEIETASRLDPNDGLIEGVLATAYDEAGQPDKAQTAHAQAIALYQSAPTAKGSQPADPLEAHLSLGDAYVAADKYDDALTEYLAAQKMAPNDARVYRGLGNTYFWKGQSSDAEREYRQWTSLAPQDATARLLLGMLYKQQGRQAEAIPELQQAAALAVCSTAEHMVLAGAYYDAANIKDAIAEYQVATRIDPTDADALYLLGVMQTLAAEPAGTSISRTLPAGTAAPTAAAGTAAAVVVTLTQAAVTSLQAAVGLRADFPQAHFALGSAYMDLRQPDKAAAAFEAAARLRPQEWAYFAAEAHAYWDLQRWEDAAAAYQKALALHEDANLRIFLGQVDEKLGRDDAASAEYQNGLALEPHNTMGWSSLAALDARQGKLAEAVSAYQQALANGDDPNLRGLLAFVYLRQGSTDAAMEQFSEAAALDPANATARLMLGNLLAQTGQLDQAATRYREVLTLEPGNAGAHIEMALLQYKRCNLSVATEEARSAAELAPNLSTYRGELAGLYEAQGREDEAVPIYASLQSSAAGDVLAHLMVSSYLARLYHKDKDGQHLDQAAHELEVSLEAAKDTPVIASFAHSGLGQVYYTQKKFIAAQSEFETALRAWDANAEAQIGLGDIALRDGDTGAAFTAYQQAGSMLPAYAQQASVDSARLLAVSLPMRRGLALARAGKREDAAAAFDEAARTGQELLVLMPQWPQAHFSLATVRLARGELSQAEVEFAAASQCDASLTFLRDPTEAVLADLRGQQEP